MPEPKETIDTILGSIRDALVPDAAPEVKARAAIACRAILQQLEPEPPPTPPTAAPLPPDVAAMVGALRGLPPDQLLDLAIARLRAALPAGVEVAAVKPIRFQIVPTPPARPSR